MVVEVAVVGGGDVDGADVGFFVDLDFYGFYLLLFFGGEDCGVALMGEGVEFFVVFEEHVWVGGGEFVVVGFCDVDFLGVGYVAPHGVAVIGGGDGGGVDGEFVAVHGELAFEAACEGGDEGAGVMDALQGAFEGLGAEKGGEEGEQEYGCYFFHCCVCFVRVVVR